MNTQRAAMMAIDLMSYHRLIKDDGPTWRFEFNRRKTSSGLCDYWKRVISLSHPLTELRDEDHVLETILHEIAHAIAGPQAGHGWTFIQAARLIGCKGERCAHDVKERPAGKYIGRCLDCKVEMPFYRLPKRKYAHRPCRHKPNHGVIEVIPTALLSTITKVLLTNPTNP